MRCTSPTIRRAAALLLDKAIAGCSSDTVEDVPREQLVNAVRAVAPGETLVAPAIIRRLVEEFVRCLPPGTRRPPALVTLSEREVQVLELIAEGLSNAEVAERLFLSEATVKTHVARPLAKLGLGDRVQAVVLAYESGLMRRGSGGPSQDKGGAADPSRGVVNERGRRLAGGMVALDWGTSPRRCWTTPGCSVLLAGRVAPWVEVAGARRVADAVRALIRAGARRLAIAPTSVGTGWEVFFANPRSPCK